MQRHTHQSPAALADLRRGNLHTRRHPSIAAKSVIERLRLSMHHGVISVFPFIRLNRD